MKIPHWLKEDRLPSKLPVIFSAKIRKDIESIEVYNRNNIDGIYQWRDYLNGLISYISNPTIAWDNTGRYQHFPNGATFIRDFDFNVGCTVKTNSTTNQSFVFVFRVNLKPEEFGLKVPAKLKENKQIGIPLQKVYRLNESDLCKIVRNVIREVAASLYEKHYLW
jgi:hypothetical protein